MSFKFDCILCVYFCGKNAVLAAIIADNIHTAMYCSFLFIPSFFCNAFPAQIPHDFPQATKAIPFSR